MCAGRVLVAGARVQAGAGRKVWRLTKTTLFFHFVFRALYLQGVLWLKQHGAVAASFSASRTLPSPSAMKRCTWLISMMALMVDHRGYCQPTPAPSKAPVPSGAPSSQNALIEATTGVQQPVTTSGSCRNGVFVPWEAPAVVANVRVWLQAHRPRNHSICTQDRQLYPDFDNLVLSVDNIYTNKIDYYYKTIVLCCGSNVTFGFAGSGSQSLYLLDRLRCPPGNRLPSSGVTALQSAAVLVGDQIPVTMNRQGEFYFADLGTWWHA